MGCGGTVPAVEVMVVAKIRPVTTTVRSRTCKTVIAARSITTQFSLFITWLVSMITPAWMFTQPLVSPQVPIVLATYRDSCSCILQLPMSWAFTHAARAVRLIVVPSSTFSKTMRRLLPPHSSGTFPHRGGPLCTPSSSATRAAASVTCLVIARPDDIGLRVPFP